MLAHDIRDTVVCSFVLSASVLFVLFVLAIAVTNEPD